MTLSTSEMAEKIKQYIVDQGAIKVVNNNEHLAIWLSIGGRFTWSIPSTLNHYSLSFAFVEFNKDRDDDAVFILMEHNYEKYARFFKID